MEVADGKVPGVSASEFGRRVAEGLGHLADGCNFAPADLDLPAGLQADTPQQAVRVRQPQGRERVRAGGGHESPAIHHVPPAQLDDGIHGIARGRIVRIGWRTAARLR